MDAELAIKALKRCQENDDTEAAHSEADDILCTFLHSLGYGLVVDEWAKVNKWYA